MLLGALALLWIGWTGSAAIGSGLLTGEGAEAISAVRDALYVVAYPLLGVACLLIVRCRTGGRDRDNLIDAAIVMAALAIGLGAWLFGGAEVADGVEGLERIWVAVAPLALAAVVGASARLIFADGHRLPAAWLLFASSSLTLLGNLWTARLIRDGLPSFRVGIDVLWVLGFVAIGAAALHPSMRVLTERVSAERLSGGMPVDRLAVLLLALLAGPFAQYRLGRGGFEDRAIALVGVLFAGLIVWRVVRLLEERDRARAALADAATRDAMLATVGRWALGDRTTEHLLAEAATLVGGALPGEELTIGWEGQRETDHDPSIRLRTYDIDDGEVTVARMILRAPVSRPVVPGEAEFLAGLAALLSTAIARRRAEAKLRHDALHDPLTGLPNRALAVDRIDLLLQRRDAEGMAVVFIDLDGFKAVNDTLGHAAGDQVLCQVADRMSATVRAGDTVARFAGDEFVVVLPEVELSGLEELVDRLQAAATLEMPAGEDRLRVTASIGVAVSEGDQDAEELLHRADAAMYRAKTSGASPAWCMTRRAGVGGRGPGSPP